MCLNKLSNCFLIVSRSIWLFVEGIELWPVGGKVQGVVTIAGSIEGNLSVSGLKGVKDLGVHGALGTLTVAGKSALPHGNGVGPYSTDEVSENANLSESDVAERSLPHGAQDESCSDESTSGGVWS